MAVVSKTRKQSTTKIIDDVGIDNKESRDNMEEDINSGDNKMDQKTIEELKARLSAMNVEKEVQEEKCKERISFRLGIVGLGHGGSRIAEEFYNLGYQAIAVNTALQDLENINIPSENKLFCNMGIGGCAKDLLKGEEAAIQYKTQIQELIYNKLDSSQILIIVSSAGGGSGAGAFSTVVDICNTTGKPLVLMSILPKVSEDVTTKSNSLETIAKLAEYVNIGQAQSLILIDNARIESIHAGISQMEFYKTANKTIVEPIDAFNVYSMMPSPVKPLDSQEFGMLLLNGGGITTFGSIEVEDYEGDLSISKAIMDSLQKNLLVSGLDYTTAKYAGYMILANKNVWEKVSTGAIDFAHTIIIDTFGNPTTVCKGIYDIDMKEDIVKIYTIVSGLVLPSERIENLKKEINSQQISIKAKDADRSQKLKIDLSKDHTVSEVDKIKQRISAKLSGLGKLNNLGRK